LDYSYATLAQNAERGLPNQECCVVREWPVW
jgi:hypothetical protein